ncbi:hypothetical protein [Kribbella monticola]|uniref:hypothetical protein n=1 Tax=Kribbella monticola TaxID=2185285 RepID=UPI000DD3F77C|nr:hypothetical protein [Kribbella monticola]
MDSVATSAQLEWWANSSTCLASFDASVRLSAGESRWKATGQLALIEDAPDLAAFRELDEAFNLRLPDGSTMLVLVTALTSDGKFMLAET